MPRLIDADALTSVLEEWEEKACDGTDNDGSDGTTRVLLPVPTTTREMIDLIAAQPTINPAPQWILVTERLPEDGELVLAWSESLRDLGMGVLDEFESTQVTHWMPMPAAPGAETDGGDTRD